MKVQPGFGSILKEGNIIYEVTSIAYFILFSLFIFFFKFSKYVISFKSLGCNLPLFNWSLTICWLGDLVGTAEQALSLFLESRRPALPAQVNRDVLSFRSSLPAKDEGHWQVGTSETTPWPSVAKFRSQRVSQSHLKGLPEM